MSLPFVSEVYKRFLHTPDYFYGHSLVAAGGF